MLNFWENGKKHFFGQKFLWQAKKKKIWVKNAKIAWKSC